MWNSDPIAVTYLILNTTRSKILSLLAIPLFSSALPPAVGVVSASAAQRTSEEIGDTAAVTLAEVNVVALKQERTLRSDAVSATVIGRDALEELNTVSIKGISDLVPNLYIPDYGSRITSSIYVRGIGARMDQPAVGLNVDNVPYLNKNCYDFDVADIASVEMLRGPQSALYGRNTMGGLINITTLSPMRWQGWRFMAEGGRGNDWRFSAGRYHKFSDRVASSLNLSFAYLGGFFRNQHSGRLLDKEIGGGARWKTQWRVSDRVYLQNALSATLLRQGGYPYEYISTGEINYNDTCFYRRFTLADGLSVSYRGEGWNLTSITSVQHLDDNMTLDQDFLPLPYFTLTQKQKETSITEDIVARGKAAGGHYKWLGGIFGFYKHLNMQAPVTFKDTGIRELIENHRNAANPGYPIEWDTRQFPLNSDFFIPTWGIALYHESQYDLGRWHFTAGIRLDYEHSRLSYRSHCDTGYTIMRVAEGDEKEPYGHIDIDIDDTGKIARHYFTWMPKASVLYDLPGTLGNVYVSVTKGYKSGGFNTQMFSEVLQQRLMNIMGIGERYDIDRIVGYRPEYSWNYEAGSHLQSADGRLMLDLSLFYIDCRDQQVTMFPSGTTTGRIMANAGRTRSFGGEASLSARPLGWLTLNGAYGYTDARFIEFNNGLADYKGKHIPYAPGHTLFLQGLMEAKFKRGFIRRLLFDINMKGTGKIYWNEANTRSQKFYALLGASATAEGEGWSLQIWGRNLTGTRYHTFYFMSMSNEFVQRGRPWQIGATLRFDIAR